MIHWSGKGQFRANDGKSLIPGGTGGCHLHTGEMG